ncbi:MAG: hypothetical protein EA374_02605 [Acholeplasmatales bacterium]|nr:MAG: hypothetical protein EA374_02605 [Acholeplasmatales bacterium]
MSLIEQARRTLDTQLSQPLSEAVQSFLHGYFQCETLALTLIRKARLAHNRDLIHQKLVRHVGQVLTETRLIQAVNAIHFSALKNNAYPGRVHVEELKSLFEGHDQLGLNQLDLLFNTNAIHRRRGAKSARVLRNEIVHGLSKSAQTEVEARYDSLMKMMQTFVGNPLKIKEAAR